jgi:hypothetical protein
MTTLAEDFEDMFAEPDESEHPYNKEEIIMKRYPIGASWYQEIYTMGLPRPKNEMRETDYTPGHLTSNGVVFRRIVMCGRAFKKNKMLWDKDDVLA